MDGFKRKRSPEGYRDNMQKKEYKLYNRKKVKDMKIKEFLKEKSQETQKLFDMVEDESDGKDLIPIAQEKYIRDIRHHAEKIIPHPMLKSVESKILELIPKKLQEDYAPTLNMLLDECRKDWDDNLHELIVKSIIRDEPGVERERFQEKLPKFGGRSENYEEYLKTKNELTHRLFIGHPIMRKIIHSSIETFPPYLVDFSAFRKRGLITFEELFEHFNVELKNSEVQVSNWYKQMIKIIELDPKNELDSHKNKHELIFCIKNAIILQIEESMRKTIEYIIETIGDNSKVPLMNMELKYDSNIYLSPTFDGVIEFYMKMVRNITSICQKLTDFTSKTEHKYLPIEINEWVFTNSNKCLKAKLEYIFEPVSEYINDMKEEYKLLINDRLNINDQSQEIEGSEEKIAEYKSLSNSLASLTYSKYFAIGKLDQSDMIMNLRKCSSELQKMIMDKMCLHHKQNVLQICQEFEDIAARARTVPKDAAELLESGVYCLQVKTKLIPQLEERISDSILELTPLLEMTTLTEDHVQANTTMINWVHDIHPILDQNSVDYETKKFEMEENLMARTNALNKKVTDILPLLEMLDEMDDINNTLPYLEEIRKLVYKIKDCDEEVAWINKEEAVFKFPISQYYELEEIKDMVLPFHELMYLLRRWRRSYYTWMDGPFEYIDCKDVEYHHENYILEFNKIMKKYKAKIKQQITDNNERRFKGLVEDPDPMNLPAPMKLSAQALSELKAWRPNVRLVNIMCNSALRQRHWDEMSQISKFDLTPDAGTTIRKMIDMDLWNDLAKYEIISVGATKELALITGLNTMKSEWNNVNFKLDKYKESDIDIVVQLDDVQAILDDHIIKTISMRGSAFVKPFETEVKDWYDKLLRVNKTIDNWTKIQYQRIGLLPFFHSKDIMSQMPQETLMFQEVDSIYERFIDLVKKNPLAIESGSGAELLQNMEMTMVLIERINNGVNEYIEKKRLYFPRFFFLSNDEILSILAETENPVKVQPHLKKCFEGICSLNIDEGLNILGMNSEETEYVEFRKIISTKDAHGSVEKWLVQVEEQMLCTVRSEIEKSHIDHNIASREEWISKWEGMVVLCVAQIYWTVEGHARLRTKDLEQLKGLHTLLNDQLNQLVTLIRSSSISNLVRTTIKALIIINVHTKDVMHELVLKKVNDDNDFNWLSQLRYYWEDKDVVVRIINASVMYAYEYLGNTERLVITPLTDRCYRTLIGAYDLHLNGAPEGPAGTGKTETVKDLAKALAKQCIVFNCSDGLDYKSMGRFFKGLASSGAWACFDEFNRIEVEVLSVVAQQILSIVHAIRKKEIKFRFEETLLTLNPTCYICITMNPGYAGRSELPDNLKVLFRTVAMMVPDYVLIGEISLYSYGYLDAKNLSQKIVTTYRLSSEQLSSQKHYDYGMRAVKTVLWMCGKNKVKYPTEDENILLLRSLNDVNFPKFLPQDVPLFKEIISDIFPNLQLPLIDNSSIITAIHKCCAAKTLQPTKDFLIKIMETYQMMLVRHGFMLVGSPLSGKTCTLKILMDTLGTLRDQGLDFEAVQYTVINPKSMEPAQLFGAVDLISNEWVDGIVGVEFRRFAKDESLDRKWIIFDGPIDAVWIENMNTVLDDNKKLCLNSGEIISMSKTMSMVFEVSDLSQASPATVSRCGMIYLPPKNIGFSAYAKSWIGCQCSDWIEGHEQYVQDLCDWLFPPLLALLNTLQKTDITGGEMNSVMTTLRLINMSMTDAMADQEEESKFMKTWIQAAFVFGIVWGLSGNLSTESKMKFDEFFREFVKDEEKLPEHIEKLDVSIPIEGLLSDYVYQYRQKGSWKPWNDIMKSAKMIETNNLAQMLVPTTDSVKNVYLLDLHIRYNMPMLLFGPTGTGKTFYIQKYIMNELSPEKYEPILLKFTSKSSAKSTQKLILSKLFKKKDTFGPPGGKSALIFIDDMNMPEKEEYGAQSAIEIIRQLLDHKFWYNPDKIFVINTLIVGNVGPIGGSRHSVSDRLLRHFSIFSLDEFAIDTTIKIFTNILQLGWKRTGFGNDVVPLINNIVSATIDVYVTIQKKLFATTKKPHYIFNIRDISRVIQGCLLMKKDSADNKKIFVKLWVHEISRVFYDRIISNEDRDWFFDLLKNMVTSHFKERLEEVCDAYQDDKKKVTKESLSKLLFGTYLDTDNMDEDKKYEELPNLNLLLDKALENLDEYNALNKTKINIVLFQYALEHLSRICRVLSISEGSILLIGIGGSGRQSITKLASTMMGKVLFQPNISASYNLKCWHDDMKGILKQSGGQSKEIVFLMTEEQIVQETFLEDIDSLLNSGEIPNLFEIDERQEILEMVRLDAQGGNRNLDITALQVLDFFKGRCKEKLHICLCLSPIGNSFRNRLRLYPSLINCCTLDWFDSWPADALEKVAYHYIDDINLPEHVRIASIKVCQHFHVNAHEISKKIYETTKKNIYITSASFLDLINLFKKLIREKQDELYMMKQRFINGLDKLGMAAAAVSTMQQELNALKPQLIIMAAKGAEMMEEIERETIEADKATVQVREDEKVANEQAAAAQALKKDCEADLALAIPILEDAIEALNTLKPADITLVKSMKNPPATVKLVMAAVCVMKSIPPDRVPDPANPGRMMLDFWKPSVRLLGDMAFLQSLKDFDKDNIPVAIMAKIRKEYLPHKDFKPHLVAKASSAAEGLCKWVIAMDMYDAVAKVVAPKKAKLKLAEDEFAATMAILEEKKAMVARLEQKVADLHKALEEANLKKQKLEEEVELCINKLRRAEKLIGGLGGEKTRWTEAAENLQTLYDNLAGDIILSCGIIAYLAPFPNTERVTVVSEWTEFVISLDIPHSTHFSFSHVLGTDIRIQNWHIAGLPNDQVSIDNAIIQSTSLRWSIFIDPQEQANKWIKMLEKPNDIQILKFSDSTYMKTIEMCIEHGKPVLIENISEELDAPLDPILKKTTYELNGTIYINLGENVVPYNHRFRLYLTTNLKNPHFYPEIYNKVTIINFALAIDGLEDQLLGIVVAKERPDLQDKREKLIIESAENNAALKNIENSILRTLQESKGDILEDEGAIQVLDSSKILSIEILQRTENMKEVEKMINDFRKNYSPVAKHSAIVYYCITDLSNIDPMYQFSLMWFINLYKYSIEKANKSKDLEKRLMFITDTVTYNLYSNVTRSLFEKDKLIFSFVLCTKILLSSHEIDAHHFKYFLSIDKLVGDAGESPFKWLPKNTWNRIYNLEKCVGFENFKKTFTSDVTPWKNIYDSLEPYNESFPKSVDSMSAFQKLMLIKILRPDKLTDTITKFIKEHMGEEFVKPPPFDISKSYVDSNCLIPLIFILSPGSDPNEALFKFAEKMGYSNKLNYLSLGQGQGEKAKTMIEEAQVEGHWVCLQNCHLATSWLVELERIHEHIDLTNTDVNFRLWLTSYSTNKFPQTILQSGIKMTNEPPTGLKNNLHRLYTSEPLKDSQFYEGCPGKDKEFSKLLYGICFFHAVVQERKKFSALGWNIPYGFDDSDFQISVMQLQNFLNQYSEIPYVAVSYLTGECNYGGRVTDDWDRRLIITILKNFINTQVINDPKYLFYEKNPLYGLPKRNEYPDFIKHIEMLPTDAPPEVYGLHENAGILKDYAASKNIVDSFLAVHETSGSSSSADNSDELIIEICHDILGKIPKKFDVPTVRLKFPLDYNESLNTFLVQEMERFNILTNLIKSSLNVIIKSIQGFIVMTPDIERQAHFILSAKIPEIWTKISYPSLKPLASYILDLVDRLEMLNDWYMNGKPLKFWISGFYFTQAFLTGGMQNFARKENIPIDLLTYDCEVVRDSDKLEVTSSYLYIFGPFFDGVRWNKEQHILDEQFPKVLNENIPTIKLFFVLKKNLQENNRYKCPVYKTIERRGILATTGHSSNYVVNLLLRSSKPADHWIKRSAAIILQLDN